MELKKGIALNQAFGAVLTLVLIGVLVIIAIFIFVNLGSGFTTESASVTNESDISGSIAYANITGYTLTDASTCNFNNPAMTAVWGDGNQSNGTQLDIISTPTGYTSLIPAANYTVSSVGVLTNGTSFVYPNVSVSYSYLWGGEACTATDVMIVQFGTYPVLVGLVGTIIFLGLVIGVLVASFAFGRKEGV